MGLDLNLVPEIVRPLALPLTGGALPETDVDGVLAEAQVLENLADLLATIKSDDAAAVMRSLRDHQWQGAAKETFEQVFKVLGGQPDADGSASDETLIDLLEKALREEAAALREHGVRMQHTEWMIYASLALLGAMIVKLLVWIYVNGPAVLRLIQHNTLLTQMNIQTLKRLILVNMLKFAGIMGGLDFGVQVAQQIWGDREAGDFDLASLAMSLGSGALTGVLFAGANAALSRLLSRQMVYVASEAELAVRDKIAAIAQSMYGQALLGGTAATAGAVPGLALSGQLDGEHLAYTFISGVAGGLDIPASARVSYIPMRAVAELGDTPPVTAPHGDAPPSSGGQPSSSSSPALPPSPRPVPHDPAAPLVPHDAAPLPAGHDTTTLAQHHPRPEQHADVATLINRQPPEPGANLPQPHQGQVIVGEVTRRQDVLLHTPAGDRAEQGGTLARPQQNLPTARAPIGDTAPATPRVEPAAAGSLPRTSLLPATVPAIITPTPDGPGAAEQDTRHQAQDSPPPETAPPVTAERNTDDSAPSLREDSDGNEDGDRSDSSDGTDRSDGGDPQAADQRAPAIPETPQHAGTDLQGGQPVMPRSTPLPDNPRRTDPLTRQVADLLSRDGAYDPISGPAWQAAHSATVERLMDTMRSSTKDMLAVGRKQNLRAAVGDPASDLVQSEVRVMGRTIRTWQAVERSDLRSFVEGARRYAEGDRRIIQQLPFDSPEALRTARRLAVEELLRTWGYGASEMLPDRLAMHMAARDEFGLTGILDLSAYGDLSRARTAAKVHARSGDMLRDFLRQQYEQTQRELASRGIEELVLYRGITFDQHPVPVLAQAANGDVVPAPPALPLQSWSAMPGVAKRYTGLGDGAVMAAVFPASRLLSTPWTGMGQLPLHEFVVLATPGEVTVLRPPHVTETSPAYSDIPPGWHVSKPTDGWTQCEQGHRHWGTEGAAGLLLFHRAPAGQVHVLMQLRSMETQHGGTMGLPGGALHRGEDPVGGGFRETGEENRLDPSQVRVRGVHQDDHGGWAYHTVIGEMSHLADVWPASRESLDNVWVPLEEVPDLNLHPDLARAWPDVRTELDRVLAAPGTGPRPPHPANTHEAPGLPDTDGFSPIADPRPRNFAEAAATVHRWTPGNGRPHQDGPQNRIERLLSNSQAGPDEVLLAEGRRLVEELPVTDGGDPTARALATMSRILNWPNPRRALHDLASELGLDLELDALVEVYDSARRLGLNPDGAPGRTDLVEALRGAMAADSYRWTGQQYQARFSLPEATPAQARTIGLMVEMMGEPVTSAKVRSFVKPVLDRYGIGDVRELLPVVRAAHEKGYFPAGTAGEAEFGAAMDRFWQDDPYLWNGVLLAERHSLPELRDPIARLCARLEEIVAHSGRDTVPPLERLAADLGMGRSAEQLVRLAADAQADGADLARAADREDLVGRLDAYRARDPYLWDGLRVAAERGLTQLNDDEARVLSRLAEITGSESPSRMWVFDPLRRLAGDAGFHHSVEQLVRQAAVVLPRVVDLFGPVDRQRVLDALGANAVTRPDPQQVPPGLHDLSPADVRDARQAAAHEHARAKEAFHQSSLRRTVSRLVGQDPLVVAKQELVASLEARTRAWQRWPERPEVSFTKDFAAYRRAYDQAVERAVRGEEVIPYMLENATASLAARDGGRGFGVEIEFELPKHNARQALRAIAEALHDAGLTGDAQVRDYHTMRGEGYRSGKKGGRGLWRLEQDGTVDGELISPILYDEPATWENLRLATEIIRAHGGTAGASTGGHVHVSTHDYDHIVENYTSLLNHGGLHTDTLFRLGHNPERESHRGVAQCQPNQLPTGGYRAIAPVRNLNGRKSAVNMESMKGTAKDHVEFRLWDGSLDPAVIQSHVKVSLAQAEAAFRNAALGRLPNLGRLDRLGTHAERAKQDPGLDLTEGGSLSFRFLMDELFWRAADKEQLTALFAATRWVPAP
ncbi:NUDIX domain-containing protein [Nonomuraea jabiensis]|uniref:ADP-ribose pyrophosphatase YjhB (NUDIX family) n=1 Tax=Nonomuraea jabiensis TaxID=882448 RepID=A0A7W9LGF3_9ACTN|nr:NUDIX domain-containing protein [Nonomuraea jabiensis]MBB5782894.1 ADP-ribose pyrophosphatase YjhB (NUDIX family) [Nonomuraea jabiensis]